MKLEKKPVKLLLFATSCYLAFLCIGYPLLMGLQPEIPKGYNIALSGLNKAGEARLTSDISLEEDFPFDDLVKIKLFDRGEVHYQDIRIKSLREAKDQSYSYCIEVKGPAAFLETDSLSGFIYLREAMDKPLINSIFD